METELLRYGFFDSEITGYDEEGMPIFDRAESSDFLAMFISSIITDGVFALPGDCFQVIADKGMNLKIRPGFAIIRGRFAMNQKDYDIAISDAPTNIGFKRIDRIILRVSYLDRKCEIIVRAGIPSETPTPPELIRPESGDYFEMCLALVTINSKQNVITQSDITDTRLDSNVCGLVTQAIDHLDTAVFYEQLKAFNENYTKQMNQFFEDSKGKYESWYTGKTNEWAKQFTDWYSENTEKWEEKFNKWFNMLQDQLSEDVAGNLQNQIYSINALLREITDDEIDDIVNGTYVEDDKGGYEPDIYSRITREEIDDSVNRAFSIFDDEGGE